VRLMHHATLTFDAAGSKGWFFLGGRFVLFFRGETVGRAFYRHFVLFFVVADGLLFLVVADRLLFDFILSFHTF
jgi:hypothetical protein